MLSFICQPTSRCLAGLIIMLFILGGCATLENIKQHAEEAVANYERIENPDTPASSTAPSSATPSSAAASSGTHLKTLSDEVKSYKEPNKAQIRHAQEQLKVAGFEPGPADGVLGPQTLQALRKYQAANGFPITGKLDEETLRSLALERPYQKADQR